MAVNKIDYDVLCKAAADYNTQAQAIEAIIRTINTVNSDLVGGFQNETSKAFIQRYESDYKKKLESIQGELAEISRFLNKYVENAKYIDQQNSLSIGG